MIDTNDTLALKDILSTASPFIKTIVDTFVKPKLESFRDRNKIKENDFFPTETNFQEYYHRTFKKLIVINTLVFNNSQKFLTDIYIPLTITSKSNDRIKEKVIGFPAKISNEYGNVLITDTAGMGKSTMMKLIFIDLIQKELGIPLFIELRRLSKEKKILSEIQEQLNSINKNFNSNLLLELLAEGGFTIILDGYDEISLADRDVVTRDLQEFISKASNNRYFITSRPEKALTSFGNFQEFKIEPLSKKEAFELLRKYDSKGQISSLLIKKLQEEDLANIEEFLTNPLLVSLLYTAFEHKQVIPFKKYLFYRQVYDANFESHDLTKGESYTHDKYSKLEIDDFHRVLRHLGFNCFKMQRIEFSKDEFLKLISASREFCVGLSFRDSDFLEDLIKTVPLFTQDGNYFRWSHKSLQEYFAAQFIYLDSKEKQNDILLKLYYHSNLEKFINVIDLYYDMDYKTFRNIIEFEFLKEFETHCNNSYKQEFNGVSKSLIERRLELTFLTESFFFKATQKNKEEHLEGRKLRQMIDSYVSANNVEENKFSGIIVGDYKTLNIFGIHYQNSKNSLLLMLAKKKNTVIKRYNRKQPKVSQLNVKCDIKEEYTLRKLTDSNQDTFNSKENFGKTNNLIEFTRLYDVTIDLNNAIKKLAEIKKRIEIEKEDDFLLDGI